MTDYYEILGVTKTASQDEIKQSYRRLASRHHPDKGGNKEQFQKIEEAYRILSNPETRAQYDQPRPQQQQFPFDGFPFADIFNAFHRQHQQPQQQHLIYRASMQITLEQVFWGSTHNINLQTRSGTQALRINSPIGIENGSQVKYDGLIQNASLIVTWIVLPHLLYSRNGSDIISTLRVSVLDLICGSQVTVKSIDGKEYEVNIPPRTQPSTVLRIPGAGLPILNTSHRGDYRLEINGIIPQSIPQNVIEAITKSKELS